MKPRRQIALVLITVTLDMLGLGLVAPVLPRLILTFLNGDIAAAANWTGVLLTTFALIQFLLAPMRGVLSDHIGRRPVILLSNLGFGLTYLAMALAPTLGWLLIGRIMCGMTASTVATALAYVADVSSKKKRAGAFGLVGAAFGFGFVLGPFVGGLLGNTDPRLPFWIAAGLSLGNAVLSYLVLPESLSAGKRKPFALARANPVGSLLLFRSHPDLLRLATIRLLEDIARQIFHVWALYTIYRFAWNAWSIGLSFTLFGICTMVISGVLAGMLAGAIGERRALWLGQLLSGAGMIMAALAPTGGIYLAAIPIISMWNISGAANVAMMSHRISDREQGELQGAISGIRSLAVLLGPALFTFTFSFFIAEKRGFNMPGAPWYVAGALLFAASLIAARIKKAPMAFRGETESVGEIVAVA